MRKELTDAQMIAKWKHQQKRDYKSGTVKRIHDELLVKKAKAEGIEITDDEVNVEIERRGLTI